MLITSRWLLGLSGLFLIYDAVNIILGRPNVIKGWPLPCPLVYIALGAGLILFIFSSPAFKKEK
jgi:hypothetical protein